MRIKKIPLRFSSVVNFLSSRKDVGVTYFYTQIHDPFLITFFFFQITMFVFETINFVYFVL